MQAPEYQGLRTGLMNGYANSDGRLRIAVGDKTVEAMLADSDAARDFASPLPITLGMNGLYRREKFATLLRGLSEEGKWINDYCVGTIGYWPPGPDVAIFYRQDGERIPAPGLIVLGKIKSGIEAFVVSGAKTITIKRAKVAILAASLFLISMGARAMAEQMPEQHIQIAEIEVDPAQLDSYKAAIAEQIEAAIRLEPGVLALYSVANRENPARVTVFEIYRDREAYLAHLQAPHFLKYKAMVEKMVKSLKLVVVDPVMLRAKTR
jgi:quinol monooxygenase YgiN